MRIKRTFDIIMSLFGLVIFIPGFLLISILIKIKMPGPLLFKQKRVGQEGLLFTMVKFRTMKINHGGSTITVRGENRITPLGAVLRKYKLDELPELWNILMGEMSFVGPRPDVPGYADQLEGENRKLLSIKPGLTGPASMRYVNEEEILAEQKDPVKYNNEVIYPDKVRINLIYINHWSFLLDIKIIWFTVLGKSLNDSRFN
jgi:lipopolysaccharide/colanic/teichoic acid biosynthesis glycosyltransferase